MKKKKYNEEYLQIKIEELHLVLADIGMWAIHNGNTGENAIYIMQQAAEKLERIIEKEYEKHKGEII